ncbi:DUF3037 domain-containing protein [Staphylococcus xylosus]|uniref:DUF3037 domain-containing protein n=1 Tax=Staphylococcus xylosus TaxID=1288 RepID=UPI001AAE1167|nr:DUF3037 domain-containing protein [Staphylococcus xylosus]MBO3073338.1 DUF3037 domain-containing protein [Staphylococcus xylosus]
METRRRSKGYYTIIRYIPDIYNGEIFNVGLILHSEEGTVKFKFIEKEESKIKAFNENKLNLYLSYKNKMNYYLENTQGLVGLVGELAIASPKNEEFLKLMKDYFSNENITFTNPKPIISKDIHSSFKGLYTKYVGPLEELSIKENTKTEVTKLFEKHKYIGSKIKKNHKIKPIKNMDNIVMKIDFVYKNGVWNYLQVVPDLNTDKKKLDFLAEMKLFYSSINENDKVKFIYKTENKNEIRKLINYLEMLGPKTEEVNLINTIEVNNLLKDISLYAKEDIESLLQVI